MRNAPPVEAVNFVASRRPKTVVVIPARNEAPWIEACLSALARQTERPDAVVVLINNTNDATHHKAERLRKHVPFDLHLKLHELPPQSMHAGQARRLAMALAADIAGPDGYLLTTDADGIAASDWVERNVANLRRGNDAVCGRALLDPGDVHLIPAHLHEDATREWQLIDLLDRMEWVLDPELHDPYPRHTEASGASLAVTVKALHSAGGIPPVPHGEDRAFIRALWLMDRHIRHDPSVIVTVSGRLEGRANGGMAHTMRRRFVQQDELTDEQVEPAEDAWCRYGLRRRARDVWSKRIADRQLPNDLAIAASAFKDAMTLPFFGAAWAKLEALSPILARQRVPFLGLPQEIAIAEALLGRCHLAAAD
jgi:glycosyltransferase involved in cell wall biosynthesis